MTPICVVTTNRADFGLLRWLIADLAEHPEFELQLIATPGHYSPQQGRTYREILAAGFTVDCAITFERNDDSPAAVARETAFILEEVATALGTLQPGLLVVLGDRYELLAVCSAAVILGVPIAHIHGGELTEGAIDESVRHAVTKMAKWHFTAAEPYRQRVIQMGESPDRVFNVGALGGDMMRRMDLLSETEVRTKLGLAPGQDYVLVTWHPETLALDETQGNFQELLTALASVENLYMVFTRANNDPAGMRINVALDTFASAHPERAAVHDSLGSHLYLSAMKYARCVVGNSSSGIIEAPILNVPTLNLGERQAGRLRANSVRDCPADSSLIRKALQSLLDNPPDAGELPCGHGDAGRRIVSCLEQIIKHDGLACLKRFHDLTPPGAGGTV